jgi:hypothetical protein
MSEIENAIALLRAAGYRVSAPRARVRANGSQRALNAVGKPYSPQYDPKYKMKHKPPRYADMMSKHRIPLHPWEYSIPALSGKPRIWEL